jgi:cytochrome d ubiquinol oxidase subunit I
MIAIGFAMLAMGVFSLWLRWRGRLYDTPLLLKLAILMGPAGFIAVLAGWITTEVGRQPYTVYGVLTTAESVSPVAAPAVAASLMAFIVVYFLLFGAGTFYILRLMRKPPEYVEEDLRPDQPIRAAGVTPGPAMDLSKTAGGPNA